MEQNQTSITSKSQYRERRPPMYDVIIHNDDVTTMDFVVMVLERVFLKSRKEAEQLMMYVHENGEAVAGTYIYDIAYSKADKATDMARSHNFPLLITVHQKL